MGGVHNPNAPVETTAHIIILLSFRPSKIVYYNTTNPTPLQKIVLGTTTKEKLNTKMSVNEVKIKRAAKAFELRGTGPDTSRTFVLGDEDHTLGNALRHVLINDARVDFAGYCVPHPSEPVVHIRVQSNTIVPPPRGRGRWWRRQRKRPGGGGPRRGDNRRLRRSSPDGDRGAEGVMRDARESVRYGVGEADGGGAGG